MNSSRFWDETPCSPLKVNRLNRALLSTRFMEVSCLAYSPVLKVEARCSSETSFFLVSLAGVRLTVSPLGTSATVGLLYQPRMIDDDDYGAVGGMSIGRGNRSTRRKPTPVPLCPPQIPHDLTWDRARVAAVGSQRLTAWAMARPTKTSVTFHRTTRRYIPEDKTLYYHCSENLKPNMQNCRLTYPANPFI
jgi:hypothetical protein